LEGLQERFSHALGNHDGFSVAVQLVEQHRELVPAKPREYVGTPQHPMHPFGDLDEKHVTGRVSEGVVDDLEPVDVEVEDANDGAVLARVGNRTLKHVDERGPVGKAGQLVSQCPSRQLRVGFAQARVCLVVVLTQLQLTHHHCVNLVVQRGHYDEVDRHREAEQPRHTISGCYERDRHGQEQRELGCVEVETACRCTHDVGRRRATHEEEVHRSELHVL